MTERVRSSRAVAWDPEVPEYTITTAWGTEFLIRKEWFDPANQSLSTFTCYRMPGMSWVASGRKSDCIAAVRAEDPDAQHAQGTS